MEVTPESLKRLSGLLLDGLSEAELKDCRAAIASKLLELARPRRGRYRRRRRWLAAHGADYVQGYFFAKLAVPSPVPAYT